MHMPNLLLRITLAVFECGAEMRDKAATVALFLNTVCVCFDLPEE